MATHPSLIKPPWVPAAVAAVASACWGLWELPRQLAQPQTCADVGPWHTWKLNCGVCTSCCHPVACGEEDQAPCTCATRQWGHQGTVGSCPQHPLCATAPSCPPEALEYNTAPVLQLGQLSWGWSSSLQTGNQPSALKNHEPGRRKSGWLKTQVAQEARIVLGFTANGVPDLKLFLRKHMGWKKPL